VKGVLVSSDADPKLWGIVPEKHIASEADQRGAVMARADMPARHGFPSYYPSWSLLSTPRLTMSTRNSGLFRR